MKESRTLFSYVNELYRNGKYYESVFGYELLQDLYPDFPYYEANKKSAIKKIMAKNTFLLKEKFHFPKATLEQKRLRIADIFAKYGNYEAVLASLGRLSSFENKEHLLIRANAYLQKGNILKWKYLTNNYLRDQGVQTIDLKKEGKNIFERLVKNKQINSQSMDGPLVTICMSCYNSADYVEKAVNSLLQQTYRNLEIIIFNDCSTDNTLTLLKKIAKTDPRVIVINNAVNQGTYISRNQAFKMAKGEYFTILDSDDYALPDRIEMQVKHLQENSNHVGVMAEWVRMKPSGYFVFKEGWGGCYQHPAVATLMIRTDLVRSSLGYWDSVKFGADTEFLFRLRKKYGKENVPLLNKIVAFSLFHENNLTNHPTLGINVNGILGLSPVRAQYQDAWKKWHKDNKKNLYMPYSQERRFFPAPDEMIVNLPISAIG